MKHIIIAALMLTSFEVMATDNHCYRIIDKDLRNSCIASTSKSNTYCYRITDKNKRQMCLVGGK